MILKELNYEYLDLVHITYAYCIESGLHLQ